MALFSLHQLSVKVEAQRGHIEQAAQMGGQMAFAAANVDDSPNVAQVKLPRDHPEECFDLRRLLRALPPRATAGTASAATMYARPAEAS